MAALDDLITELERSYTETRDRMSDPAVYNDHREAAEGGRRLKQLEGPYNLAQEWKQARADLNAARAGAGRSGSGPRGGRAAGGGEGRPSRGGGRRGGRSGGRPAPRGATRPTRRT